MQKTKSDKENKIHNKMTVRKKDLSERKKGDKKKETKHTKILRSIKINKER